MSPHFTDEKLSLGEIREFAQGHAPGNSGSPVSHICIFCRTVFLSLEKNYVRKMRIVGEFLPGSKF